jgi:hypothetical protein
MVGNPTHLKKQSVAAENDDILETLMSVTKIIIKVDNFYALGWHKESDPRNMFGRGYCSPKNGDKFKTTVDFY